MKTTKGGRPKTAKSEKRDIVIRLKINEVEKKKLMEISDGILNMSEFIRNRLFFNSTFQQVQPEVFIKTLNELGRELAENRNCISESLLLIKNQMKTPDYNPKEQFDSLIDLYRKQLKLDQKVANYMKQMLKAGRKTNF